MFSTQNSRVAKQPRDGDQIILSGNLSIFQVTGQLQLVARTMEFQGLGQYYIQFEALKKKLAESGLFEVSHKQSIPKYPFSIGVIVGDQSAAQADIRKTLAQRWPVARITEYPTLVQGEQASAMIIQRLTEADNHSHDVLILARGGGSIEDLWAFNSEILAGIIYQLKTPIITGIGHEIDTTIADYVADYRAPTPTAAAQKATPVLSEVNDTVQLFKHRQYQLMTQKIRQSSVSLQHFTERQIYTNPERLIENKTMQIDYCQGKLTLFVNRILNRQKNLDQRMRQSAVRLKNRLEAAYVTVENQRGKQLDYLNQSMVSAVHHYEQLLTRLNYQSPLKIMAKGFAITEQDGQLIHSVRDIGINDLLTIRYADGTVRTKVIEKETINESD